jgi:hypothetical protein
MLKDCRNSPAPLSPEMSANRCQKKSVVFSFFWLNLEPVLNLSEFSTRRGVSMVIMWQSDLLIALCAGHSVRGFFVIHGRALKTALARSARRTPVMAMRIMILVSFAQQKVAVLITVWVSDLRPVYAPRKWRIKCMCICCWST